jgi:hypothetical protein
MEDIEETPTPIEFSVYAERPFDRDLYIQTQQIHIPDECERTPLTINTEFLPYLGTGFKDQLEQSTGSVFHLYTPHGVEYYQNVMILFKFIEEVISEFSESEREQLHALSGVYHRIDRTPILLKLHKMCLKFALAHKLIPQKNGDTIFDKNHVGNIFDFGVLCEDLNIPLGVMCTADLFRYINKFCNPFQIGDMMNLPQISDKEATRLMKRTLYFAKNPDSVYEPNDEDLQHIPDIKLKKGFNVFQQMSLIKKKYEEEEQQQQQRMKLFDTEVQQKKTELQRSLTDTEMTTMCEQSQILTDDDKQSIKMDNNMKSQRFEEFRKEIVSAEDALGHKLCYQELNDLRNNSTILTDTDKSCISFEENNDEENNDDNEKNNDDNEKNNDDNETK